jgi:SAM-dependent methyltransferase
MQPQARARIREAWTAFWREPASRLQCLAGAPDVAQALRDHWSVFAAPLPANARVLDIGCGAGAASRSLIAARPDLRITGLDFARVPPAAEPQIRLLSDTPMESMPFADASFDAAISQFGFEYGRTHKAARELARVLAPRGTFSLVVHHAESSILATNRARLNALLALQQDEMRAAFLSGSVTAVNAEMSSLRRDHPGDTLVAELARVLPPRAQMGGRERSATWSAVEVALAPEQAILEALDSCCVAPEEIDGWLGPLRQFCAVADVSVVRKANGQPIAWQVGGLQRAEILA